MALAVVEHGMAVIELLAVAHLVCRLLFQKLFMAELILAVLVPVGWIDKMPKLMVAPDYLV
jgi:hypothetical protein